MFTSVAYAEIVKVEKRGIADDQIKCEWNNSDGVPCVTIYPRYTNNSNALGDKITPTLKISKSEISKYNLIDLPKVLNSPNLEYFPNSNFQGSDEFKYKANSCSVTSPNNTSILNVTGDFNVSASKSYPMIIPPQKIQGSGQSMVLMIHPEKD